MIKIYIQNIEMAFLKAANKKLNDLLNFYFYPFDNSQEEYLIEDIFPEHLFRNNKEKCINTAYELREYVKDLSIHTLTPLHEYALLNILSTIKEIEEDLDKENDKVNFYDYDESDNNEGFTLRDLDDIYFYLENCFQDYDFHQVEMTYEAFFKDPSIEEYANINLEEYKDLVQEDIFKEYKRIKEVYLVFNSMLKDKIKLEKQNGEVFNDILSSVQGDEIFIFDSPAIIEEGDRIYRVLSNGHTEQYLITRSDFYNSHSTIPAHYELKVRKENAMEYERIQSMIINDYSSNTFNGDNNRINKHSTDNSTNNITKGTDLKIFSQLRDVIAESDLSATEKDKLISEVASLEESVGTPNYQSKYQKFITAAANHMTLIAPFIPELTKLLGS